MAEGFNSHSFDDDCMIIPNTPSPVFKRKAQLPINNISPIKKCNSGSTVSMSPPAGGLSLPGSPSFASERAEAVRRKKMKDKISNRLVNNGLSPVKRLSPDKAGFVKSSTLVNNLLGSSVTKSPSKNSGACALDSLKRDLSPNMLSPNLYERIKGRQRNKIQNKAVSNASASYGWPSDSDSSDDEILASAVDSLQRQHQSRTKITNDKESVPSRFSQVKKHTNKDVVQMFLDSDDDEVEFVPPLPSRIKNKTKSATQTSARSPGKSETILNHSPIKIASKSLSPTKLNRVIDKHEPKNRCKHPEWCGSKVSNTSKQKCDRHCDKQISPHLENLTSMCSNLCRLKSASKESSSNIESSNDSNLTDSQTTHVDRKRKHETVSTFSHVDLTGTRNSLYSPDGYNKFVTGLQTSNNSNEIAPRSRLERKKTRETQSGMSSQDSLVTGSHSPPSRLERKKMRAAQSGVNFQDSNLTGSHSPPSRLERKRKLGAQSEGWMSKVPRPTTSTRTKTPTKDRVTVLSGDDATPETRNIINVVSQLEKDEEVARQLQEELDREFALHLQDQSHDSESGRSGSRDPFSEVSRSSEHFSEEEDYRYHSPFGDIGGHGVAGGRRGNTRPRPDWHMFDPVTMGRNRRRRDDTAAMELEQLMAETANSLRVGFGEHFEMPLPSGARSRRRRGRVGRAGVFSNIMITSPNTSGNDYEALMQLGEMLGDAKNKGLSKTDLQRLPTTIFKADENNPNTECHICMDDYEAGDSLKILPCFHSYHGKCIDNWIKQNATCPVCRVEIRLS